MPTTNGNGRSWQLAFWVITSLCGVWLLALTNGVVANDRIREAQGVQIRGTVIELRYNIYDKLMSIDSRLSKIEAVLSTRNTQ